MHGLHAYPGHPGSPGTGEFMNSRRASCVKQRSDLSMGEVPASGWKWVGKRTSTGSRAGTRVAKYSCIHGEGKAVHGDITLHASYSPH